MAVFRSDRTVSECGLVLSRLGVACEDVRRCGGPAVGCVCRGRVHSRTGAERELTIFRMGTLDTYSTISGGILNNMIKRERRGKKTKKASPHPASRTHAMITSDHDKEPGDKRAGSPGLYDRFDARLPAALRHAGCFARRPWRTSHSDRRISGKYRSNVPGEGFSPRHSSSTDRSCVGIGCRSLDRVVNRRHARGEGRRTSSGCRSP